MARKNQTAVSVTVSENVTAVSENVTAVSVSDARAHLLECRQAVSDSDGAIASLRHALRIASPITSADAIDGSLAVISQGGDGTALAVSVQKRNKKSVRVVSETGRTFTLYHEGGRLTHVWCDVDYRAERLWLYGAETLAVVSALATARAESVALAASLRDATRAYDAACLLDEYSKAASSVPLSVVACGDYRWTLAGECFAGVVTSTETGSWDYAFCGRAGIHIGSIASVRDVSEEVMLAVCAYRAFRNVH